MWVFVGDMVGGMNVDVGGVIGFVGVVGFDVDVGVGIGNVWVL